LAGQTYPDVVDLLLGYQSIVLPAEFDATMGYVRTRYGW